MNIPVYGLTLNQKHSIFKEPVYGYKNAASNKKETAEFVDFRRVSYSKIRNAGFLSLLGFQRFLTSLIDGE
ncbi:hypothetical protein Lac3_10980 [Claveliimonas bilis]|nr:hypothetical protein Lac3_10980 [Claveliimonas bilis]